MCVQKLVITQLVTGFLSLNNLKALDRTDMRIAKSNPAKAQGLRCAATTASLIAKSTETGKISARYDPFGDPPRRKPDNHYALENPVYPDLF